MLIVWEVESSETMKRVLDEMGEILWCFKKLIYILPVIFLPEDMMSQHIIPVLQFLDSSCIANQVHKVVIVY